MKTSQGSRKRALIVVDVQPSFINKRNEYVVENILNLLHRTKYDVYIEANFHAEKGSIWDIQQKWTCPKGPKTETVEILAAELKKRQSIHVIKETKSTFKGNKNIAAIFRKKGIQEVYIVGFDSNDCVLATAYEAFDLGFITYVIEECSESSASATLHKQAMQVLRGQNMTNHSG